MRYIPRGEAAQSRTHAKAGEKAVTIP